MGAGVRIEPRALRQLSRPRTAEPSKLKDLAEAADRIANEVEHRWSELSAEARDLLGALAYSLIEPPKGARRFRASLAGRMFLALAVLKGQTEALYEYLAAVRRLIDAVLTAVERESAEYQSTLSAAVDEALGDSKRGRPLSSADLRGWLDDVSNQAQREV